MEDFERENVKRWSDIHNELFPIAVPRRAEWTNIVDIVNVLNLVGKADNSNYAFLPDRGGSTLRGAVVGNEEGSIEVDLGITYILKPEKLIFESFNKDLQWNYFRIETKELDPTGVYDYEILGEELTELSPGNYVHRVAWDEKTYDDSPLPKGSRLVKRMLKGSWVIFRKTSLYNKDNSTTDGRHNKMNTDEFRNYIESNME